MFDRFHHRVIRPVQNARRLRCLSVGSDHSGALALHAFVVFEPVADAAAGSASASAVPTTADLRRYLQSHLPDFMIPVTFTARASLRETPSGKVDRRALAQAEAPLTAATE